MVCLTRRFWGPLGSLAEGIHAGHLQWAGGPDERPTNMTG